MNETLIALLSALVPFVVAVTAYVKAHTAHKRIDKVVKSPLSHEKFNQAMKDNAKGL